MEHGGSRSQSREEGSNAQTYFIKPGYQHRTANVTLEEEPGAYWTPARLQSTRHHQVHAYLEARRLIRQHGLCRVLDVGCGIGYKLVTYLEPVALECVGIDQASAVEVARKLFPRSRSLLLAGDIEARPPHDLGVFDLVTSIDVIEHLLDPSVLLDTMRKHCHERSWVLISTPERDMRRGPDCMKSPKVEHVREWNREELKRFVESRGFRVVEQLLRPGFRVGWSWQYVKERWQLIRDGVPYRYNQVAICRPA
jgi:SAM-dependent methyltransferase